MVIYSTLLIHRLTLAAHAQPPNVASFVLTMFNLEFMQVAKATTVGFLVMGFIGFFVKLIHIPINNIIMGG